MLADLDSVERRLANLVKKARGQDKDAKALMVTMEKLRDGLAEGIPARAIPTLNDDEKHALPGLQLLTGKPVLYVCNVSEDDAVSGNSLTDKVAQKAAAEGADMVIVSAAIESEIISLDADEKKEFLDDLGLEEAGLARMINAGYHLLNLITFFTVGPKEARAWTLRNGGKAPEAAGVIHTDFQRGFIRAETISYDDYITHQGETGAKDAGKLRIEGADYLVKDGDVFHFRFNV
jgi:GTP-binding protein YchF